jgi:NAD(P)-dependent dehydrogenase (short-subunit alcohol dehydrogenase family)
MPVPMNLKNRTAVVTGAGSGIGRGVAHALARRGCNLALADIDLAGLEETVRQLGDAAGLTITRHRLDVADREAVYAFPGEVLDAHGKVDVLVNNAGVALGGTFEQVSEADFEWLFDINFWGVVRMTRAFLPSLKDSDDARIVNVSSVYGLIAPPGQTAYAASKFAVRGFSQALGRELAATSVGMTVVHPGGVATAIARSARKAQSLTPDEIALGEQWAQKLLRMPPEQAGEIIVRGVEQRRARILVGSDARMLALVERITPVGYWKVVQRMMLRS